MKKKNGYQIATVPPRSVIAFDCVEVASIENLSSSIFLSAAWNRRPAWNDASILFAQGFFLGRRKCLAWNFHTYELIIWLEISFSIPKKLQSCRLSYLWDWQILANKKFKMISFTLTRITKHFNTIYHHVAYKFAE